MEKLSKCQVKWPDQILSAGLAGEANSPSSPVSGFYAVAKNDIVHAINFLNCMEYPEPLMDMERAR